jgi:hypothetical protein
MSPIFTVLLVGILHNRIWVAFESCIRRHGESNTTNNCQLFSLILFVWETKIGITETNFPGTAANI